LTSFMLERLGPAFGFFEDLPFVKGGDIDSSEGRISEAKTRSDY